MGITVETLPDAADSVVHISAEAPDLAMVVAGVGGAALIIFVLFVLPLWLFLHYRARRAAHPPASTISTEEVAELNRLAERVEARLDALETLKNAESPHWRTGTLR